jgi:hypothetical protein
MLNYLLLIGFIPIIVLKFYNLSFLDTIKKYSGVPFPRHLMLELLKGYKRPNDKISELIKSGELLTLKRGLYLLSGDVSVQQTEPFLVANHLRGPSYISLESALAYWSMIPERVYEVSSATLKGTKNYTTPIGRFSYYHLSTPYFSFGVKRVQLSTHQYVLIASPEKAICDKIIFTSGIVFRSKKQVFEFLCEDLRIDVAVLKKLDFKVIEFWLGDIPKKSSIQLLVNYLKEL